MEMLFMRIVLWIKNIVQKNIENLKDISDKYYISQRTMKDTGWNFYIYRPKAVSENAIHKLLLKKYSANFNQCSPFESFRVCFLHPYGVTVGIIDREYEPDQYGTSQGYGAE